MTDTTKQIAQILKDTDSVLIDEVSEGSLDDLATRLDLVARTVSQLKVISDILTEDIASRMEDDTAITGVGVLQRKSRSSSTWIDDTSRERMMDDTISAIIRRVAVDPATGEVHQPLANTAREVWRITQDAFSFTPDPKVAFRKVLGLTPDEYRSKRLSGYTISISPGVDNV